MRWTRILLVVIGSSWFFLVSCSASLFVGVRIVAAVDARDVIKGNSLHSGFSMVIESGDEDEPFQVIDRYGLRIIEKQLNDSDPGDRVSFLMSKPSGQLESDTSSFSYQVIEENESGQLIEVVETYHDGDNTIWSRYEATQPTIRPLSSRMFYFGYMFAAFPFAIGFASVLNGTGRYLQQRNQKSGGDPHGP